MRYAWALHNEPDIPCSMLVLVCLELGLDNVPKSHSDFVDVYYAKAEHIILSALTFDWKPCRC